MKKIYCEPDVDLVSLDDADVIHTSGADDVMKDLFNDLNWGYFE